MVRFQKRTTCIVEKPGPIETKMKLYFMGICGTAMGNAALLARAAGHEVLGADSGVYPPMSTVLIGG